MYPPSQWAITTNVVCTSLSLTIYFQSWMTASSNLGHYSESPAFYHVMLASGHQLQLLLTKSSPPYDADIPEHLQQVRESECMRWKSRWEKANDLPGTLHDTLEQCSPHEFPNIAKAFTVLLTLPNHHCNSQKGLSVHWGDWRRTCAPPWKKRGSMALHSCTYTNMIFR